MSVLGRILGDKRADVARRRARLPPEVLATLVQRAPPLRDFGGAVRGGSTPRVIAEVKRASPSKGVLRAGDRRWDPVALARAYQAAGARCLSVLTDTPYFWGSDDHLVACREATSLPVLRKDFVVDVYQVDESRWLGADCVLLMASVLDDAELSRCAARALELGMTVLLEAHSIAQLERTLRVSGDPARLLVGINHRDLETLEMDMGRALALRGRVPEGRTVVAESGLRTAGDLRPLLEVGIGTFLVGGHLAASDDPAAALAELLGS